MLVKKSVFLLGDAALLAGSVYAAYWLRFDGHVPEIYWSQMPVLAALSLAVKLPVFLRGRLYMLSWSQIGLEDMVVVFRKVTLATGLFWLAVFLLRYLVYPDVGIPRSVLLVDYVLTLNAVGAFRVARRVQRYLSRAEAPAGRLALIVGAGAAGEQLALSLRNTAQPEYTPIGFIDDDRAKLGTTIRDLRVLGGRAKMAELVRTYKIEAILIAMPSAGSKVIRNVVAAAREAGAREVRTVPSLDRLLAGQIHFSDLREVQLADLLGREEVRLDTTAIRDLLSDRTVLVTGAAGSIGAELSRQLTRFRPRQVVLVDSDETGLFWIEQDLKRLSQRHIACLADVRNTDQMMALMHRLRPDVVFHAAAYKHVDLMERHPEQAILTNVQGTRAVAEAALAARVDRFVLISTDKAVNPTSVMGASKRVAEQICLALNGRGSTRFMAVRFGNVLGSRGSVVPLFQDHIRRGEPITIRGRNMRRYFMAASEAVLLVLEAGAVGNGGETFVLDMGEPIRILDLAADLIRMSGLEPERDVPIVFEEPLPGEKEEENLLMAEEGTVATRHERILVARSTAPVDGDVLLGRVDELRELAAARAGERIIRVLCELVPSYEPSPATPSERVPASVGNALLSAASKVGDEAPVAVVPGFP